MKEIKIIIDGKEITATIDDSVRQQLLQPVKKTGYERVETKQTYYVVFGDSSVESVTESCGTFEDSHYIAANYYSDKTVAENNARADKLMRQLRRFAVEHREKELDWVNRMQDKYYIYHALSNPYNPVEDIHVSSTSLRREFGAIYFDTKETAQLAIYTFKDELLWYFTEYKDSL